MRLDTRTIVNLGLTESEKDKIVFDETLPGFGLRLRFGGSRAWIVQYRNRAGRTRRYTLGAFEKLAPPDARRAAKKILGIVAVGGDPQNEKVQARLAEVHTLRSTIDKYLAARKSELRPASYKVTALYLTNPRYFGPLHRAAITAIGHADVAARISAIKRDVSPTTARQARTALSGLFAWAAGEGLMGNAPANPLLLTNVPAAPPPRERVLKDAELVAIWKACSDDDFGRIVRLLTLLGSRRAEVGGMRRSEIDAEAGAWLLPSARAKNKCSMLIPLSGPALKIINEVTPRPGRDCLFGDRSPAGFVAWTKRKHALDRHLGDAVSPWNIHDLRRTTASRMGDLGVQPHVIEAVLNHQGGHKRGVAGIYNRSIYANEVKAALALWAEHVMALVEERGAKVVPLRA
jgi:integrase